MSGSKSMETDQPEKEPSHKVDKMFTLKKWNLVAMWSWDVECDTCAICRVQVMGKVLISIVTSSRSPSKCSLLR